MALTAAMVRTLPPGKYLDGHGLVLDVKSAQRRYWTYRFTFDGRERSMSLGNADVLGLAAARTLHAKAHALVVQGIDPLAAREQAKAKWQAVVTFAETAERTIMAHRAAWRGCGERHWRSSLRVHAYPVFGHKPVDRVTANDVLAALEPIWASKTPMAKILRGRIEAVLDYAKARGWRTGENPAMWRGNLKYLLPKAGKVHTVEHHAALDWRDAPALMANLLSKSGMAERCLAFLMLTASRSAEAREARWSEFGQKLWVIPAHRMKAGKEHRVPLSDAAMAILHALDEVRHGDLVFFGHRRGRPLGDTTLTATLRQHCQCALTVHGMRSCFRDWCADHGQPADLAEMALAHAVGSAVERSYRRSDVLERRRLLMEQWAQFLTRAPATVVPLQQAG